VWPMVDTTVMVAWFMVRMYWATYVSVWCQLLSDTGQSGLWIVLKIDMGGCWHDSLSV